MSNSDNNVPRLAETGRLLTLLMEHRQPILLLGAGASVKSGVPGTWETVNRAARWAWCKENGRSIEDPSVVSSDWRPWLEEQAWFNGGLELGDQYPVAIDNLLGVAEDKREFFESLISRGVQPSEGYSALARIMDNGWISTVLTTNFDHCLHRAAILEAAPPYLVEIKTPSDWTRFDASPSNPQLIHIHGSVEHYSDMNLVSEVASLDSDIVERLRPLLRDHPLVVVGYRGMEASVMTDLLFDQCEYTGNFRKGIYWCDREGSIQHPLSEMTQRLASQIGTNFNRVPIKDFDHLLKVELLDQLLARKVSRKALGPITHATELPPDMREFQKGGIADLDEQLLFQRLLQYAHKHSEAAPEKFDGDWLRTVAVAKKILHGDVENEEDLKPTLAGWILFGKNPTADFPHGIVQFKAKGPESWLRGAFGDDSEIEKDGDDFVVERDIGGTLWNQLNVLVETTAALNTPFVLKEAKSRQVTPYHPLAIKEMIVNALVHRDYETMEPIKITITPTKIETISPGGLTEEVAAKTGGQGIETLIRQGSRGEIKGYRNPVISGLFYGSSEMDRKGSGLSDMFQKTVDNNGEVSFGAINENTAFRVVLFSRPEGVDEITRTAVADQSDTIRFSSNIVEFSSLPKLVWHAGTSARSRDHLVKQSEGLPVPPGFVHGGRFFSFYDLENMAADLVTPFDIGDVENITFSDTLELDNGFNIVIKLLYDMFNEHLRAIGLLVDEDRRRAYYPKGEEANRKKTYRGRVKRATRTIVKARTKRDSEEVLYYEHKSFGYSIMPFGEAWGVFINPGYVFTKEGRRHHLGRERTNILSTKRAARDFNTNVMHDVNFWMACLSDESDGNFKLKPDENKLMQEYFPEILLNSNFPGVAYNSTVFETEDSIDEELDRSLSDVEQELESLAIEAEGKIDDGAPGAINADQVNGDEN